MSLLFEEINEVCGVFAGLGLGASLKSRVNKRQCLVRLYLLRVDFSKRTTPAWNFACHLLLNVNSNHAEPED
jgi:hypothetical protein